MTEKTLERQTESDKTRENKDFSHFVVKSKATNGWATFFVDCWLNEVQWIEFRCENSTRKKIENRWIFFFKSIRFFSSLLQRKNLKNVFDEIKETIFELVENDLKQIENNFEVYSTDDETLWFPAIPKSISKFYLAEEIRRRARESTEILNSIENWFGFSLFSVFPLEKNVSVRKNFVWSRENRISRRNSKISSKSSTKFGRKNIEEKTFFIERRRCSEKKIGFSRWICRPTTIELLCSTFSMRSFVFIKFRNSK